jgi:hypothetical protein
LLDLNKRITRHTAGKEQYPLWNNSGFGSNDTGKERDRQKVSKFDAWHPLDLESTLDLLTHKPPLLDAEGRLPLNIYLKWLSANLPFTFRFEKTKAKTKELADRSVDFEMMITSHTMKDVFLRIHAALPPLWAITILRGKVVLYRTDTRAYKSPIWRLAAEEIPPLPSYTLRESDIETDAQTSDSPPVE